MIDPQISFGAWVARVRKAQDLTQLELANRVGCSVSALRKIEADERRPSREVADLLATALDIPQEQRAAFLKIARRELRADRTGSLQQGAAAPPPAPEFPAMPAPLLSSVPAPSTPLVGREHELSTLADLLRDPACRLVTLVGPGGIGKTRLAQQVATDLQRSVKDGVFYVELTSLTQPSLIAPTIASAIGCVLQGPERAAEQLIAYLRPRELLLVLDNMEHLLEGADLLAELLQQAPRLRIVVTSRERLNLHGEWIFEVQGLPVPPAAQESSPAFEDFSAVQLFLQSARRARVGFSPSVVDRAVIVRICRLVDGLPLAIELAAGWVRILSCTEIAEEIEKDLDFLASSARDVPQRHRSMTAVFDQSWALLSDREREVMRRLSVFRGGFEREAAEQVAAATLQVLSALVARSLVRRSGPHRYDLHELVRQYCEAQLAESQETAAVRSAHARTLRDLVIRARVNLIGPDQQEWLDRLEAELYNLRSALEWCAAAGEIEAGLEISTSLAGFWYQRDYQAEGCQWLLTLIGQAPDTVDRRLLIDALNSAGYLAYELGSFDLAREQLERALVLLEDEPNTNLLANALVVLGQVYGSLGEYAKAGEVLEQALALAQDDVYAQRRRGSALMALADVTSLSGDDDHAQFVYAASAAIYRDIGDGNALAYALRKWGWSALHCNDLDQAESLARESLALNQQTRSKIGAIACIALLAAVHARRGDHAAATAVLAAIERLMEQHSVRMRPMDQVGYTRTLAVVHAALTPSQLAEHWASGHGWTLEQAIDAALR